MSLTVTTQPLKISPVFNSLTFNVTSSNYSLIDYKYVFSLYVNGSLVDTSKLYPRSTNNCLYDPSKILQNYLTQNLDLYLTASTIANSNEILKYSIIITGEYNNAGITSGTTEWTSPDYFCWNGVYPYDKAGSSLNTTIYEYLPYGAAMEYNFLNFKYHGAEDNGIETTDDDNIILTFLRNNLTASAVSYPTYLDITAYTYTNCTKTYSLLLCPSGLTTLYWINHVGIGLNNLSSITWTSSATTSTGLQRYINSNDDYAYKVQITNDRHADIFTPIYFKIKGLNCYKYKHYQLIYRNGEGGWGFLNVDMKRLGEIKTEKSTYSTKLPYNYNKFDRSEYVFTNNCVESYEFNTNWLVDNLQILEIKDLLYSNIIYLKDGANITPVNIINHSVAYKDLNQDKGVQYNIKLEEAFYRTVLK